MMKWNGVSHLECEQRNVYLSVLFKYGMRMTLKAPSTREISFVEAHEKSGVCVSSPWKSALLCLRLLMNLMKNTVEA
jgi:hypothetical protein